MVLAVHQKLALGKIYELLIKCEVKMAEYWPSSFCRRRWSQGPLTCTRNEQHQYPAILTGHAWSIEDLLCVHYFFLVGTQQIILSGQDSTILLAQFDATI